MKAEDAAEMMDQDRSDDRFKQWAAIAIGVLAMLLAITGLGGANAGKEATNNNIRSIRRNISARPTTTSPPTPSNSPSCTPPASATRPEPR